jgi:hypothetical protein
MPQWSAPTSRTKIAHDHMRWCQITNEGAKRSTARYPQVLRTLLPQTGQIHLWIHPTYWNPASFVGIYWLMLISWGDWETVCLQHVMFWGIPRHIRSESMHLLLSTKKFSETFFGIRGRLKFHDFSQMQEFRTLTRSIEQMLAWSTGKSMR